MYVFIRSCIALTRGVVKIIQTDPDSFFSSRSGTLSSTAAPTYHLAPSLSSSVAPSSFRSFFFLPSILLYLDVLLHRLPLSSPCPHRRSLAIVPMPNSRSRPMTSLPLCISFAGRAIRESRASLMITGYNRGIGTTRRSRKMRINHCMLQRQHVVRITDFSFTSWD